MLTVPTLERLRELKLDGMAKAFEDQIASSEFKDLSFEEWIGLLVDRELTDRNNRRPAWRISIISTPGGWINR